MFHNAGGPRSCAMLLRKRRIYLGLMFFSDATGIRDIHAVYANAKVAVPLETDLQETPSSRLSDGDHVGGRSDDRRSRQFMFHVMFVSRVATAWFTFPGAVRQKQLGGTFARRKHARVYLPVLE